MDNLPPPQKKGLGALGWLGIGCGGIVFLILVAVAIFGMKFGGQIKELAEDAQKNPTRAAASAMVKMSFGQVEMVAEDDEKKRYTVREKASGKLTTLYWSEKAKKAEVIPGDFSAIPVEPGAPREAVPAPAPK